MYLKFNVTNNTDVDFLEEMWEKAVELAMKFVPSRGHEVVTTACARLLGIRKFESAGEFYNGIAMYREAIDAFASGGLWDKAKEVVKNAPKYREYLENSYVTHLKSQGQADALVSVDIYAGLDLFAQRGEWHKCLEKASVHVRTLSNLNSNFLNMLYRE